MTHNLVNTEQQRMNVQAILDSAKDIKERNFMGQFSTPPALADQMLSICKEYMPNGAVSFLDPAFGTGSFYTSFLKVFKKTQIKTSLGIEIDPHYGEAAKSLWAESNIQIIINDFTHSRAPQSEDKKYNLIVCNPPYVRHHHIPKESKEILQQDILNCTGIKISQLTGLYGIFLLLSIKWMKQNGLGCWLIPSEFLDVNYGRSLKKFLLNNVELVQIHRFDPSDVQFEDALVSSAVVFFRNQNPNQKQSVKFTYGGSIGKPKISNLIKKANLDPEKKWHNHLFIGGDQSKVEQDNIVRFGDLFTVKRGIATGANDFFILNKDDIIKHGISKSFLRPILPSPRQLKADIVDSDRNGEPKIDNPLFLLDTNLPINEIQAKCKGTYKYLLSGIDSGISERYLCKNRTTWYFQEKREPAPLMVTYMGRSNKKSKKSTFRFIRNKSNAIGANTYLLLYPTNCLTKIAKSQSSIYDSLWSYLNENDDELFKLGGRVYGGGLHKLEPKELAAIQLPINDLL